MTNTDWETDRRAMGLAIGLFIAAAILLVLGMLALAPLTPDDRTPIQTLTTPLPRPSRCPLPAAPTDVTATPEKGYVTVTWTDPQPQPTTYRLYRRTGPAASWVLVTEVTLAAGAPRQALDATPASTEPPAYAVRVVGVCGESPLPR